MHAALPEAERRRQENAVDSTSRTEHFSVLRELRHDVEHVLRFHNLSTQHAQYSSLRYAPSTTASSAKPPTDRRP